MIAYVTADPIDDVDLSVSHPAAGAVVEFRGVIRNHDDGSGVVGIHYEGHPDADAVMRDVVAEAATRDGVHGAAAVHRIGDLTVGDVAFLASISASHRAQAFEACSWLVDEVKRRLPVWKNQEFTDGTTAWTNCP